MFTLEEREYVRDCVVEMARADPRVTAGALTGSKAVDAEDEWSDIDIAFGIADGSSLEALLDDWTDLLTRELGVLHYWDLRAGPSIYRVFLLPSGLEIDVGVWPQQEFGARGPRFRTLFGTPREVESFPKPTFRYLAGLGWHHVLHARTSIERGKPWRAEYWISQIREKTIALACVRLGEEAGEARGVDRLPAIVTEPLAGTLVRSLDEAELRRALGVATACFLSEVEVVDPALCARLTPLLREYGAPQRVEKTLTEPGHPTLPIADG